MPSLLFYTVTNHRYFPGTVATLSSIRRFHPESEIWVFSEIRRPLTPAQLGHLESLPGVHHRRASEIDVGSVKEAWQMKAHAAQFLSRHPADCLIQVDSDAILCSDLSDLAQQAMSRGLPAGGKDGKGIRYDDPKYAPYHSLCGAGPLPASAYPAPYISTSILFLPMPQLAPIVQLWSGAVDEALFGPKTRPRQTYPGYLDQGVFNALIHFKGLTPIVLDNDLLSQHWVHGTHKVELREGVFWNQGRRQITFHSVGHSPKFWAPDYPQFVTASGNLEEVYRYWLWLLFEGPCGLLSRMSEDELHRRNTDYFPGLAHDLYREYLKRTPCAYFSPGVKALA